MAKQLGIFCGTFNPIHWGHLLMAETARDQLGLDKMLIITSPNPPHRHTDLLDGETRFRLVQAALQDNDNFVASRMEIDREGPSYTVDTLRALRKEYGDDSQLNFLVGEDNLEHIGSWHQADDIFRMARIIVAPRAKQAVTANAHVVELKLPAGADMVFIELAHIPVSSSDIRNRLRDGRSVMYLVPPPVEKILRSEALYK